MRETALALVMALAAQGCSSGVRRGPVAPGPPETAAAESPGFRAAPARPARSLTLDEAIELAVERSPRLAAREAAVAEALGELDQARAWRNPALFGGRESITFDHDAGGDQAQDIAGVSYPFALGRPVAAASARAAAELRVAEAELELARRRLRLRLSRAFTDALIAEDRRRLAGREREVLERLRELAAARFRAGDLSEREVAATAVAAERVAVALVEAESARDQALRALAAEIGDPDLEIEEVVGEVDPEPPPIDRREIERRLLEDSPLSRKWEGERARALGRVREAEAAAWPVLTLSAAYRRYAETEQDTVDIGVQVPLPVFDRNAGAIRAARARLSRVEQEVLDETARTIAGLRRSFDRLESLAAKVELYRERLLPAAERSVELAEDAFEAGAASTLDVLEAERQLIRARREALEARGEHHRVVDDVLHPVPSP